MRKIIAICTFMVMTMALTGCDIKFIEKVDSSSSEETSVTLPEPEKELEVSETEIPDWEIDNSFEVGGLKIIRLDEPKTVYATGHNIVSTEPKSNATTLGKTSRGMEITKLGYSANGVWAYIEFGGEEGYMKDMYLSEDYIETETTTTEKPDTGSIVTTKPVETAVQGDLSPTTTTTSETETETSVQTQQTQQQTTAVPTDNRVSNIVYPNNPPSITNEYGMLFADTMVTYIVIRQTVSVHDTPSSGGTVLATYPIDTNVTCTGIGDSGWCRISMPDGRTGYIETQYLMKP